MKKTVLVFGLISGVLVSAMMAATVPFADKIGFDHSEWLGYTIAGAGVPAGVLRDTVVPGQRGWRRDHVWAGVCRGDSDYADRERVLRGDVGGDVLPLHAGLHGQVRGAHGGEGCGLRGRARRRSRRRWRRLQKYKAMYQNVWINAAMTFVEPFPVGLVVTLISAGVLRRKATPPAVGEAVVVA